MKYSACPVPAITVMTRSHERVPTAKRRPVLLAVPVIIERLEPGIQTNYASRVALKYPFSIAVSVYKPAPEQSTKPHPTMRLNMASSRTARIVRAHLPLVALGCLTLQLPLLGLIFIFQVPEAAFKTASFRGFAFIYVVCFVVSFRLLAWLAHAQITPGDQSGGFRRGIVRSHVVRRLSRMHLGFCADRQHR
jgi:hypothetical protein